MHYEGFDIEELRELVQHADEPVVIVNSILTADDVADPESFHGWIFEPEWYSTQVISWGPGAVSSRTTVHQRLVPPADWVPVPVPEPEEPGAPAPSEPADPGTEAPADPPGDAQTDA